MAHLEYDLAHSKHSIHVDCPPSLTPVFRSEQTWYTLLPLPSFLAVFVNEHVQRVSTVRSRGMFVADLCFVFCGSGRLSTQLSLNSSPEMTDGRMDGQPDQGQTVSIRDSSEGAGLAWESQPPGLLPLLLAVGSHQEMGPTYNFPADLLGKSGGFIHHQCGVEARHHASPPKSRDLPE